MIRMSFSINLQYQIVDPHADLILNVHAAQTRQQFVVHEQFEIQPAGHHYIFADADTGARFTRLRAGQGPLAVGYSATVDLAHYLECAENIPQVPINALPSAVLSYLYPSRYCESDQLRTLANRNFGHLPPGYQRVVAIKNWVRAQTTFRCGCSNDSTSAVDTLVGQVGVCRDFSHLMIALCRALSMPARFVTGIDYGADPALGPPDFHAYVEVFLGDRWYLFDPTGISPETGLIRIGTGRDAADVAFATLFGAVSCATPRVTIKTESMPGNEYRQPEEIQQGAVSTMALA